MLSPKVHFSRPTGFEIYGQQLEGTDTIDENDVYLASDGREWKKCGRAFAGMRVGEKCPSLIVHPLPVATFPPPCLPRIKPRAGQIRELPYRCRYCRSDLRDYFQNNQEEVLKRALEHIMKGSTQRRKHISCERCLTYYRRLKGSKKRPTK